MNDDIRRKLDLLDELYPKDRLQASKARVQSIWEGISPTDRFPVTYEYATFNMYNALHSPEQRLHASLDEFIIHGRLNDDLIPAVFPGCRQSTIPSMFGAREVLVGNDVTCERIVATADDIDRLPEPSMGPGTVARMWLEMQEYFLEETDAGIPVHVVDMQGPVDVAGQLMSYDAMLLLAYDDPDRLHLLLQKATDAFILFWSSQRDLLGDNFVGTHLFGNNWVPGSFGASMSIDSLVMYGPDFYREFVAPSLSRVGEVLGPVSVHSCGDFSANVHALCETTHLAGINASQMAVRELLDAGMDPAMVLIALCDRESVKDTFDTIRSRSLLPDLTICRMPWPERGGNVLDPASWSASDWDRLHRAEDELLQMAECQ